MNYYEQIKEQLINNEVYKKVKDYSKNRNDLMTYYNVGKLLIEAQGGEERAKYGDNLIKEYSKKLMRDLNKKYNYRYLCDMRKLYLFSKVHPLDAQLSMSHYRILFPIKNTNEINFYINLVLTYNLSKRKLQERIKSNEYKRLSIETKNKEIEHKENKIEEFIKNPIIIKNSLNKEIMSEKALQELILDDLPNFLKELGDGFSFIDNEYPIKLGPNYNYIDLLLFNIEYNCYVVIELKITPLKKEHIGQIQVYMNYIDKTIKKTVHNKTIGIILSKKDNEYIIKYCSDPRIIATTYSFN